MKLGTRLLRDAVISLDQLEAGLRAQILYGGRLGTNLVEDGALDLDTLGAYLADILDVPTAPATRFERAEAAAIELVGDDLAHRYQVFPLGFDDADRSLLALAMVDPRDYDAVEAIADATGLAVARYIAPELRILYHLERHYGLTREARYVRAGTVRPPPTHRRERRRMQPPRGLELPPAVRLEPRSARSAPGDRAPVGELIPLREIAGGIDTATSRQAIGDAIELCARGRFGVLAAFILRDANALGWRCARGDGSTADIARLSIPLGGASSLQAAHDTGRPFRGPPPAPGQPAEKRLWIALDVDRPPEEVAAVPVVVRDRCVNLLYAHAPDGGRLSDRAESDLREIAERAGEAYVRLIRAAKRAADAERAH